MAHGTQQSSAYSIEAKRGQPGGNGHGYENEEVEHLNVAVPCSLNPEVVAARRLRKDETRTDNTEATYDNHVNAWN